MFPYVVAVPACRLFVLYEPLVEYFSDSFICGGGGGTITTTTTTTTPVSSRAARGRPSTSRCPPAPLVLYVEDFLSEAERAHLLDRAALRALDGDERRGRDAAVHDSEVALVPRTAPVRCLERLRTQRYRDPAGHYVHHFDWGSGARGWGRVSSVNGDGEEGGFEDYVGATFRPVPGNAVFRENFRPDGTRAGWEESWHAGLPVKRGVKVGLNIWSW
ncbi:hypothetical protein DL770_002841 [Monosporascus sp. CRB-9-2]|nr:hypothetical protein DL770_002841 [Monosporascus sp. CRB-9-2]